MASISADIRNPVAVRIEPVQEHLARIVDDLIGSLPQAGRLSSAGRRGIIARYCSVLEGNFIYWMTAAQLAVKTEQAREIIRSNLFEEVRDCHPGMLRKFAVKSGAVPTGSDAAAVLHELTAVRLFVGRLDPVPIVAMMAMFEEFIRKFMPYLADLARRQGSEEQTYTRVHSTCDFVHAQELLRALKAEMSVSARLRDDSDRVFEGVHLLETLIQTIIKGQRRITARRERDLVACQ